MYLNICAYEDSVKLPKRAKNEFDDLSAQNLCQIWMDISSTFIFIDFNDQFF